MCAPAATLSGGLEVADIVRAVGERYRAEHRLCGEQDKALRAIAACRTPALGGHIARCDRCGAEVHHYHSCRNRHCPTCRDARVPRAQDAQERPKCQTLAKERWIRARQAELLPVNYFHVVFTLPHALNILAQWQPRVIYRLLFQSAAETLLNVGADPRWLGAQLGITAVLHTWGQQLDQHIHLHCIVTGGGLTAAGDWRHSKGRFLFPVRVLSKVFRGKYLAGLEQAWQAGTFRGTDDHDGLTETDYRQLRQSLYATPWVVYAKPPFGGPEQVVQYLGRYTHRIAIGNQRLVSYGHGRVSFRWRDYADDNQQKVMTLAQDEFLRRFLLHVLPKGFQRVRHYGLLANRGKGERLARAREALEAPPPEPVEPESVEAFMLRVLGVDIHRCPRCGMGRLVVVFVCLPTRHPPATGPPEARR